MFDIFRATQRIHDDGLPRGGIHPEQKLSLVECLCAFTYGGAYQLEREKEIGTLEAGKLADITVLDKNLFTANPGEYRSIESCLTVLNGRIVYQA
jgi:predicted amidohydrolase YtcJ